MKTPATVISADSGEVRLIFSRPGKSCGHCGACGNLSFFTFSSDITITIKNCTFNLIPGDRVLLQSSDFYFYLSLLLVFFLPLLLLIMVTAVLQCRFTQPVSIISGFTVSGFYLYCLKYINPFFQNIYTVCCHMPDSCGDTENAAS